MSIPPAWFMHELDESSEDNTAAGLHGIRFEEADKALL